MTRPLPRRDLPLLLDKLLPALRALVRAGYFSFEVEGAELVPREGPAVYAGNHGGWFILDTLMAALAVVDHVGADRLPWGAAQDQALRVPGLCTLLQGMGAFPVSWLRDPGLLPGEMRVFSVYPEGTEGNCKPFWRAYRMRPWHSGFVRLAASVGASIVPVAILGGEECLPVAGALRILEPLIGTILPVPLSLVPLPTRWKIVFHEPVRIREEQTGAPLTFRRARRHADSIGSIVQRTLDREAEHRFLGRLARRLPQAAPDSPGLAFGYEHRTAPAKMGRC